MNVKIKRLDHHGIVAYRWSIFFVKVFKPATLFDINLVVHIDQCSDFGCENLFSRLSFQACELEQVDTQFNSLDSTSYSLTGQYNIDDNEEHPIEIKHGHSKDHWPDLKQVVQEMIVSQDGGVPLACKIGMVMPQITRYFKSELVH